MPKNKIINCFVINSEHEHIYKIICISIFCLAYFVCEKKNIFFKQDFYNRQSQDLIRAKSL